MVKKMNRRNFIFKLLVATASSILSVQLNARTKIYFSWHSFIHHMELLARSHHFGRKSYSQVAKKGVELLTGLDISSDSYKVAVDNSYESGNNFWLWNRLYKKPKMLGGILTIGDDIVPLHDHPGAVGMVRIISGRVKVWQFEIFKNNKDNSTATLKLINLTVLNPGDTAYLTPEFGNIHALQALGGECSMLDFFIPPYNRSKRNWYEPLSKNWKNKQLVDCKVIPDYEYYSS